VVLIAIGCSTNDHTTINSLNPSILHHVVAVVVDKVIDPFRILPDSALYVNEAHDLIGISRSDAKYMN